MATYTTNYQLHQWAADDDFLRTDFNEDLAKIDTAIKGVETAAAQALTAYKTGNDAAVAACARIATGTYTGTSTFGADNPMTLTFDFQPRLVFIGANKAVKQGATLIRGCTVAYTYVLDGQLTVAWNGNSVSWYGENQFYQLNENMCPYYYVAIG